MGLKVHKQVFNLAGKELTVETGRLAWQSQGAVLLTLGGTSILSTAVVSNEETDLDYFPLSVEYIEKMYASGNMTSSRFSKREGRPSDEAVIKAREVDHSIRSLFPKSFKRPVAVTLTVMAYDGVNDPQALTVLGASLALMQSGVPFYGPCASVVVGLDKDNNIVLNPDADVREGYNAEFIISAVDDKLLSLEGWGKEVSEETMDQILDKTNELIKEINKQQIEFVNTVGKTLDIDASKYPNKPCTDEAIEFVKKEQYDQIKEALFNDKIDRNLRLAELKKELLAKIEAESLEFKSSDVKEAVEYVARRILRDAVLKEEKRVSNRKLDEIRELKAEIDILPTVHGSALFSRGLTQSLSIVTLAPKSNQLLIDDMEGESSKNFMHHYNFPPFSTGEAGKYSYYPGRREIGHGAIGENALMNMIPSEEDFPYTVRAVSEILSSNGSTSMAATCASSLALMAAGVPMKEQVAGIGVGLITNDEDVNDHKLLLDIEGIEDFYGDMDFKVTGTKNGITAMQYENKLQGVPMDILKKAFRLAKSGRMQVLEVMNAAISAPRADVAKNAPKIEKIVIKEDQIGELIGPGGKNIKELVEESGKYATNPADINIEQDGTVFIAAMNEEQMNFIKNRIQSMFKSAQVGEIYEGTIDKIVEFGMFVDVTPKISGLVHISEVSDKFTKNLNEMFKVGQKVRVKVIKVEDRRISFSMKGVEQPS